MNTRFVSFCLVLSAGAALLAQGGALGCNVYSEDLLEDDDGAGASGAGGPAGGGVNVGGAGTGGFGGVGPVGGFGGIGVGGMTTSSMTTTVNPTTGGAGGVGGQPPTGEAWINEIHYDNDGGDVGEGVEIAGTAGLSLSGWSLVFYNGSTGAAYQTEVLAGTIPNQLNGFGAVWVDVPMIQNGAPTQDQADGVALVDGAGLVEFLSYEGVFVGAGGPASGVTSIDLGVAELSTTPSGESLQLFGTGSMSSSFTWTGPVAASPGAPNAGQTFN